MSKRYIPITAISITLGILALIGYMLPATVQDVPAKILFENNGGRVIFSHLVHADDYGISCDSCHHEGGDLEDPLACGTCHPREFDDDFLFEHMEYFPDQQACAKCHEVEDGEVYPDLLMDLEDIPTRTNAFHGQCMDCHEEMDAGPFGENSCYTCHAR